MGIAESHGTQVVRPEKKNRIFQSYEMTNTKTLRCDNLPLKSKLLRCMIINFSLYY